MQLILKQYKSNFVTYDLSPVFNTIKDIAEAVYIMLDHKGTLQNEYDGVTMKTKLILKRSGGTFGTLIFDEKSFYNTLLNFSPHWIYKRTNAIHVDSPGVYTSEKI